MILNTNEPDAEIQVFILDEGVLITAHWVPEADDDDYVAVAAPSLKAGLRLLGERLAAR